MQLPITATVVLVLHACMGGNEQVPSFHSTGRATDYTKTPIPISGYKLFFSKRYEGTNILSAAIYTSQAQCRVLVHIHFYSGLIIISSHSLSLFKLSYTLA